MSIFKKAPKPVSPVAAFGSVILTGMLLQLGASAVCFVGEVVSDSLTARKERKALETARASARAPQYAQPRANG